MAHRKAAVHTRASWAIVAKGVALWPPRAAAHENFLALLNGSAQPMRPSIQFEIQICGLAAGTT
jgi:hypothetical protein